MLIWFAAMQVVDRLLTWEEPGLVRPHLRCHCWRATLTSFFQVRIVELADADRAIACMDLEASIKARDAEPWLRKVTARGPP